MFYGIAPGLCYTFNSKAMVEIFEEKFLPESWQKTFNLKDHVNLTNPSGFGPTHGFNFAVNMFKPYNSKGVSKDVIIAITNDNNAFDIFKQNYVIEPGFSYTFRIIANQVIFSCEFH